MSKACQAWEYSPACSLPPTSARFALSGVQALNVGPGVPILQAAFPSLLHCSLKVGASSSPIDFLFLPRAMPVGSVLTQLSAGWGW